MGRWFSWITVILWMSVIFYLSHQPAVTSKKLSQEVTEVIVETIQKVTSEKNLNKNSWNHVVRKHAHFFAYFVLGLLVIHAVENKHTSRAVQSQNIRCRSKYFLIAVAVCVVYAVSDEIHQLFVPGRGAQVTDVMIDSVGSVFGIGLYLLFSYRR